MYTRKQNTGFNSNDPKLRKSSEKKTENYLGACRFLSLRFFPAEKITSIETDSF